MHIRALLGDEIGCIRQRNAHQVLLVQDEFFVHQVIQVEHIGGYGIDLIIRQRLGAGERHGPVNVVPERTGVFPVTAHSFVGPRIPQGILTTCQGGVAPLTLAEGAMTLGTLLFVKHFAINYRTAARR